ncbi:general amidase-like protein [Calycina marina]|uniref:amidase n=1 Tax=Calycina marina TaxID=1763456 RepID=A0A9P7Z3S6_9HELO|nr:general amidase-like protein [Calycina marina]
MTKEAPYKEIALRKQAERQSRIPRAWLLAALPPSATLDVRSIPRNCGILTAQEIHITEACDATALAQAIRQRKVTSEAVTIAFCKRAAIAQQVTNCLTEIFFQDAIATAKLLDEEYARTGIVRGPLHGVPMSLKDTFKVKGYDASIGIASLAKNPAKENSLLVDILLEQGAVLYCKTGIPQTLMALDSENHLFGRVMNPRNRLVTAGGSSGGEGALIGMRGSVLGVGTDVGGSIRVPAMCNGLYGIKPSARRVPYVGQQGTQKAGTSAVGLPASAGPLATSIRDCELFMEAISNASPWERDPHVYLGGLNKQGTVQEEPLIGIIRRDGVTEPHPPVNKVLDETAEALRRSGIDVIEIDAPAFKKCQSLTNKFFGVDGNNYVFDLLEATGEPLVGWLQGKLRRGTEMSLDKLVGFQAQKTELETEMLKIWREPITGRTVDAIILPVAPHPVAPIDRWSGVGYTSSFVLLDYPAGTLPVRDFQEADMDDELTGEPLNSWDKNNRELWNKPFDRSVYLNTKLSIQVIAPKLQERRLLQAMNLIDRALRGSNTQPKL